MHRHNVIYIIVQIHKKHNENVIEKVEQNYMAGWLAGSGYEIYLETQNIIMGNTITENNKIIFLVVVHHMSTIYLCVCGCDVHYCRRFNETIAEATMKRKKNKWGAMELYEGMLFVFRICLRSFQVVHDLRIGISVYSYV